jgi:hypothetical protein
MITGVPLGVLLPHGVPGSNGSVFQAVWLLPLNFVLQLLGPASDPVVIPQDYQSLQQDDTGVQLIVQVTDQAGAPVNIATADVLTMKLLAPDGTPLDFTAKLLSNGADGKLYYVTRPGDLAQAGLYQIQAKVTMAGSSKSSRRGFFWSYPNVDAS